MTICGRFGSAFDVFLASDRRGTVFEAELVEDAYQTTAAQLGPDEDFVTTDVFSCDDVRMAVLEAAGFERFRVWDEVRECNVVPPPAAGSGSVPPRSPWPGPVPPSFEALSPSAPGFVIRSARLSDADGLAAARASAFGTTWTGDAYRSLLGCPGFDPEREVVAVTPDGTIAAFVVFWLDELNQLGHIEPLGTHGDYRRLGLGRAVMTEAMRRMALAGMTSISVNHDAQNASAGRLYESLGFAVRHVTYGYRRPRPTSPLHGSG